MVHNYNKAYNGRKWIIWYSTYYRVDVIDQDGQFIHCHVATKDQNIDCLMKVVYVYNTAEQRRSLWSQLDVLGATEGKTMADMGRFQCHTITARQIEWCTSHNYGT